MDTRHVIHLHMISETEEKDMSRGMRDMSKTPLTDEEIEFVKAEIKRIQADETLFVFNDPEHIKTSTCYGIQEDKIYVTRNVFPDEKYGSTHPRDLMSVGAVLAHEYYGHRAYRDEYLSDIEQAKEVPTTPYWQDECRASIRAARMTPNLTERDVSNLIMDAIYRAKEAGHVIELDDFMKEALYGYPASEKNISREPAPIRYIREEGDERMDRARPDEHQVSKVRKLTRDYEDFGR